MKQTVIDRLVSIKSIVTLVLTGVFAYLSIAGVISGENFLSVFLIIIGFYFGSQTEKKMQAEDAALRPGAEEVSVKSNDSTKGKG